MSIDPLSAGIDLVSTIVSRIWPDSTEKQKAELQLALAEDATFRQLMAAQLDVNKTEAATGSLFLGGWRSFVGWVCGIAFAWHIVIVPILMFIGEAIGHPFPLPVFDITVIFKVLLGMLGLGS